MTSHFVTDGLGPTNARSTSYAYTYESHYDQPPIVDQQPSTIVNNSNIYESSSVDPYETIIDDPAGSSGSIREIERQSTQTQKVTRMTKVTTTRSVRQMPASGPNGDDLYFNAADGNVTMPIDPINNNHTAYGTTDDHHNSGQLYSSLEYQQFDRRTTSLLNASPPGASYSGGYISHYATPGSPGAPQVVDVDSTEVTLVWLRPDIEGDDGPIEGYQVQIKSPTTDVNWRPAHAGFIAETQCKISNLEPNSEQQFRVVAKNSAGVGSPSAASAIVQLRPRFDGDISADTAFAPYPPGRPQVLAVDADRVLLAWEPPVVHTSVAPVAGYHIEYRAGGTNNWVSANDFLVSQCRYQVQGLRPNGEYEFRILARNADGLSEPSTPSGLVRIKPPAPQRAGILSSPTTVPPPSQPQMIDADSDWVTLMWAPPSTPRHFVDTSASSIIGYIVESREIGDPNWFSASERLIASTQITVRNLRPNSTYEFRVLAKAADGGISEPSEVSDLVQLRPKIVTSARGVPAKPHAPELLDINGDQVSLCWLPAQSVLPVQGYDVEFRDYAQAPSWFKVNDLLIQNCKMTIGDLLQGHEYEFRVVAKNAMGYSEASDPCPSYVVGSNDGRPLVMSNGNKYNNNHQHPVRQLQDEMIRESPPLPDRDDSPPPIHRPPFAGQDGLQWRDPTLNEVLEYLSSPNSIVQLNASGYLQHLTFNDNDIKEQTRDLGGIPKLVDLLSSDVPEIQKNACGCLKNLAFGKENDLNKIAIRDAGGIPALAALLRKTPDMQVKEELTGALWNLSSFDILKIPIMEMASEPLVRQVIVPGSGWSPNGHFDPNRQYNPNVFRNGTGVVRNVSAASENARKLLRNTNNLIDSLVHYLHLAIQRNEIDSRSVENVVCLLRNLSYRVQEVDDPNYDPNATLLTSARDGERSKSAPSGSPKFVKKKESSSSKLFNKKRDNKLDSPVSSPGGGTGRHNNLSPAYGSAALLWQPELVKLYLKLLQEASNVETLEASAGALQNLAACSFEPSAEVRATVRKEKGLPILVELLRLQEDKVVCAVTTALRNLSLDQRNRELIGKYAMKDLVNKLPAPSAIRDRRISDATIGAVLGVLFETVRSSADFTRNLHECGGTDRLRFLARAYPTYGSRVCKYASQVLYVMWQHKELHDGFKRAGFKETDFFCGSASRARETTTLARPISTQGAERPGHGLRPDLDDSGSSTARYGATGSTVSIPRQTRYSESQPPPIHDHYNNGSGRSLSRPELRQQPPIAYPRSQQSALRPVQQQQYQPLAPRSGSIGRGVAYDQVPGGEPLYASVQKRNGQKVPTAGDSWV